MRSNAFVVKSSVRNGRLGLCAVDTSHCKAESQTTCSGSPWTLSTVTLNPGACSTRCVCGSQGQNLCCASCDHSSGLEPTMELCHIQ
ncbi:hypothetical protein BD310DRAFT_942391 [Dichomitus squalens]|uniref:Uncharacterized protein n=1 Tax=Dichomitus squalens TaxID=114155 RepID=A0A4Q9PA39_9APHY|nr:hypothetical protein BD310DRAFT_942391 [Dichomitus squalens]